MRKGWLLVPAFALALGAGIGLGMYLAQPHGDAALGDEAISSHVRATLGGHLVQIASTDPHMLKPWLSARLAFSPTVVDFAQDGFPLEGGRVDYLGGQAAAALVYKRRQYLIDVFIIAGGGDSVQAHSAQNGFNLERFAAGGMRYWVVSDLNRNELADFARMLASRR
jgi:anti-sigma factor RsiW